MRGTVNPSGRLSDAFWSEHRFNPVYANWGTFFYSIPSGGDSSKITQDNIGDFRAVDMWFIKKEFITAIVTLKLVMKIKCSKSKCR